MNRKQRLGQFFTKQYAYILDGFNQPNIQKIIEPFAGQKDLLHFLKHPTKHDVLCYDIDPQTDDIIQQDTLLNPPTYHQSFVLTNPPFLARNKTEDKSLFDQYKCNDLFKCFLHTIINDPPLGGIVIIPLNFWCSIRQSDIRLRRDFLSRFSIHRVNVFEEDVFSDTSYTICAFEFSLCQPQDQTQTRIHFVFYPSRTIREFSLTAESQWMAGGELYGLPTQPNIRIERLTTAHSLTDPFICHLKLFAIDNHQEKQIRIEYVNELFIDKTPRQTERTFASFRIEPLLSIELQKELAQRFNDFLTLQRDKYHSMFLSTYRESKDMIRKRISFSLVYRILNYLLAELLSS